MSGDFLELISSNRNSIIPGLIFGAAGYCSIASIPVLRSHITNENWKLIQRTTCAIVGLAAAFYSVCQISNSSNEVSILAYLGKAIICSAMSFLVIATGDFCNNWR